MAVTTSEAPDGARTFRNRSGRLKAAGVILVLLAVLSAIFTALQVHFLLLPRYPSEPASMAVTMMAVMATFAVLTLVLLWAGVGSFRQRRWVRPIALSILWPTLAVGLATTVGALLVIPPLLAAFEPPGPDGASLIPGMVVTAGAVCGFLLVVVPGLLLFLLQPRDVQLTCDARDRVPRWTDGVPIPTLALAMWLYCMAATELLGLSVPVYVLFGEVITGWGASALTIGIAVVTVLVGRAVLRRQALGWWGALALLLYGSANSALFLVRGSFEEMLRAVGTENEEVLRLLARVVPELAGPAVCSNILWWMAAGGFLLYVKRFFPRSRRIPGE